MSLKAQINEDMKAAMRAKETARLSALRLLLAAIKQKEVDERIELDDAAVITVVDKMLKQRRDSVTQYEAAQRFDLASAERFEIDVLTAYKPAGLTVEQIAAEVDAAIKDGATKFGGKIPNKAALKLPLRDGDLERDDEAYKGAYFVNANSTTAPQIVDRSVQPILDRAEVYSGCYARVSVNFYAFNSNGNRGIACGLNNLQKIRDGEPLGGKPRAEDDFATADDDDFLA